MPDQTHGTLLRRDDAAATGPQPQNKRLHASPFVGMAMRYQFRIAALGERTELRIK
jgi:DUF1365 family protein